MSRPTPRYMKSVPEDTDFEHSNIAGKSTRQILEMMIKASVANKTYRIIEGFDQDIISDLIYYVSDSDDWIEISTYSQKDWGDKEFINSSNQLRLSFQGLGVELNYIS